MNSVADMPNLDDLPLKRSGRFFTLGKNGSATLLLKARKAALGAAIVGTAWVLAYSAALLVVPPFDIGTLPPLRTLSSDQPEAPKAHVIQPLTNFEAMGQSQLFQSKTHAPIAASAPQVAATRSFGAVLLGTVNAEQAEWQRVVVQFQGKQHVMRVGQTLDGFTLVAIQRRAAVFKNGETELVLRQDKN